MHQPEQMAAAVEQVFTRIHTEQMAGMPILNDRLKVQTLGFQVYRGRCIGVLITPWLMNLMIFPGADEDWSGLKLGSKQQRRFPSNSYKCMVNQVDGIGYYQSHSLHSPMHEFQSQEHALAAAESFMQLLMTEVERPDLDPHDEELLGRILRGEETPDLSEFASVEPLQPERTGRPVTAGASEARTKLSRRDLLHGTFIQDGPSVEKI